VEKSQVTPEEKFRAESDAEIQEQGADPGFRRLTGEWMDRSLSTKYSYHFTWLGRPVIQYPQDLVAMQEIIHSVQPDLIIETGIAHGGSLIFYASLLELNALCGGPEQSSVVGIDIDIRAHNRAAIEAHPMSRRITMIEGSSTDPRIVAEVGRLAGRHDRILVCLDSNHSHDHVMAELEAYAPMVSADSYCVVFDTIIEELTDEYLASTNRPWRAGDSPGSAVEEFLRTHTEFEPDTSVTDKLMITVASGGYLKKVV
jgi:cephalosporin hydroxylase